MPSPGGGAVHCGRLFQDTLKAYGMRSSMSRRGDCWDNAPTQSLWSSLNLARLHSRHFATRRGAISPMTFEKNWAASQQEQAA